LWLGLCGLVFGTAPLHAADAAGKAVAGDTVLLHYEARVAGGEIFETTDGQAPRGITLGQQQVLPALETALLGLGVGDRRRIEIPSPQAFGPYRDEPGMRTRIARASLSHRLELVVGARLNAAVFADAQTNEAQHVSVTIVEVHPGYIIVDANHPLAGKDLQFDIEIVDILRPTTQP
ncbi:MAG: FKBP-type peptidyl-prolyl cis-trans isomerase, partial [Sedimenticolaceae bacterium]